MVTKSRMETARHAAWRQFGRRHYRWFVYGHLAGRAAPWVGLLIVLGTIAWAVAWAWHHVPSGAVALLAGSAAALVLLGWAAYEFVTVSAARKGVTAPRLAMSGASAALALAAVFAVMHR